MGIAICSEMFKKCSAPNVITYPGSPPELGMTICSEKVRLGSAPNVIIQRAFAKAGMLGTTRSQQTELVHMQQNSTAGPTAEDLDKSLMEEYFNYDYISVNCIDYKR